MSATRTSSLKRTRVTKASNFKKHRLSTRHKSYNFGTIFKHLRVVLKN